MINLYIIRHGETAGNVRRLIQGVTNSHLNARGRKQAYALGVGLRISGLKVERIVASDLIRAQETAQQILLGMQKSCQLKLTAVYVNKMMAFLKAVNWKMFPRKFSGSRLSSAGHQWQSAD